SGCSAGLTASTPASPLSSRTPRSVGFPRPTARFPRGPCPCPHPGPVFLAKPIPTRIMPLLTRQATGSRWCVSPPSESLCPQRVRLKEFGMSEDKVEVRDINYRQTFPWVELFRGFQVALDPKKLLLAAAGIVVMSFGWWLWSLIFFNSSTEPQES